MDTVTILRDLWRLRLAVVVILVLAVLAGVALVFKLPSLESRKYEVGVATARILVDTPSSQVVEVAPKGSDTLGIRANLLASLMVDGVVKSAIAQRAGIPPEKLVGISEASSEPGPVAKPPGPRDFVLTTRVLVNTGGDQLPIIEIDVQAPDRANAAKLGVAAMEGLRDYLDSTAAKQQVADADRLKVSGLGAPQAVTEVRGPSITVGVIAVLFTFGFGSATLLGFRALVAALRAASAREKLRGSGLVYTEDLIVDRDDGQAPDGVNGTNGQRASAELEPEDDWFEQELAVERGERQGKSALSAPRGYSPPRAG
jgi:hypothetical protein